MKKLLSLAAVVATGVTLGVGNASVGAAYNVEIRDTGRRSNNTVQIRKDHSHRLTNTNNVGVTNNNDQTSKSGHAWVKNNDGGAGDASTGNTQNTNNTKTNVNVSNTSSSAAAMPAGGQGSSTFTIAETGRRSNNTIDYKENMTVVVENENNVSVTNNSTQEAKSGDATVQGNDDGAGDAKTGDAHNTNTTETTVHVSN